MGYYQPISKILFTLSASGAPTTLTASGDSVSSAPNGQPIDLREVCDLVLSVNVTGAPGGTAPTLVVQVDMQDSNNNWIPAVIKTASLNASGLVAVYGGLHNASQVVLTGRGRVSWTIGGTGGPSFPVQISLIGR